ncbi:hypothetical protein AL036_15850 [Salipiger aestuarii]|uniref:hypothetical protein n=1 Tax=Salipiger aestuarii TaxID=568098 RepID=UPI00123C054D|nr:hypothetical protein [Salipiger aestuarii]KAA8606143.1 hypothetical protein AL036_15850 [Salipiger aestuarii]
MPQDNSTRLATSPSGASLSGPLPSGPPRSAQIGLLVLAAVLVFGAVQLYFWTDRGIWIDEISQLLNYPLDSLGQAFGPLPEAQQAAPPLFNLLFHAIAGLPVRGMRIVMAGLTLMLLGAALIGAFGRRPLPLAAALLVLLGSTNFLVMATDLKFYAFDIAGFAIFSAWILTRDRSRAFGPADAALIVAAMLLGVSTIVGGCVVVGVFFGLRLRQHRLRAREIALAALAGGLAFGYYLQISYATELQIASFPDTYGGLYLRAVLRFLQAGYKLFEIEGVFVLLLLGAVLVLVLRRLQGPARAALVGLIAFGVVVSVVFAVLAAIGKYPASSDRHVAWMLGICTVLAGAAADAAMRPELQRPRRLAAVTSALLALALVGPALRSAAAWPAAVEEGAAEDMVATLAELPPSDVLLYYGAPRLVSLELARGAPIGQHRYAPLLSTHSSMVDPSSFGPSWMKMDDDSFSRAVVDMLRDDPDAWATMVILLRLKEDFRPLARFVLDAAPGGGAPFYVAAIHVPWDETRSDMRARGLMQVLDERGCAYAPLKTFPQVRSPGFVIEVTCP